MSRALCAHADARHIQSSLIPAVAVDAAQVHPAVAANQAVAVIAEEIFQPALSPAFQVCVFHSCYSGIYP